MGGGASHTALIVIVGLNLWCHTLPFCIIYFSWSSKTIICKLQFLVLICMQKLHRF